MGNGLVETPQWDSTAGGYYDGGAGPLVGSGGAMESQGVHLSAAALFVLLIGLYYLTDAQIIDIKTVRFHALELLGVALEAIAGIFLFKWSVGKLTQYNIRVPGLVELAAFI